MILVTGGTGLLGSRLIYDLVKAGVKVRAIKRAESDLTTIQNIFNYYSPGEKSLINNVEWVNGNIMDIYSLLEAMNGVREVYHCAASVSFNPKTLHKMMKANIEGTANVVNACLENSIRKLCHTSSVAAIGIIKNGKEANEDTLWRQTPKYLNYSISKFLAEREIWRGIEEGQDAVIVNPSIIIGPGNWRKSSANMFPRVWNGLPYYTSGTNGFVDVRDVSRAMIVLMKSEIKSERFIISSENKPYKEVFELIADNLGKKHASIKVTPFLAEILWRLDKTRAWFTASRPAITKEIAREASLKRQYSNIKIKKTIGLDFIPVEEAIKHTSEIFLKET
ncbi:MAG: NAD-dependent epimerase/dehydratase family protein [Bacteroidota bacterium]